MGAGADTSPAIAPVVADAGAVARAAEVLRSGGLVAFPTETVYGLGADATDARAVARIFEAKGRPSFNPLIVHFPDAVAAAAHVDWTPEAQRLAEAFWPGALTLVLPRRTDSPVCELVSAGLPTIALRVPAHPVAQALLAAARVPVAAPSANPSGRLSPTTAAHVAEGLGARADLILDGGRCPGGLESSVLDLTGKTPVLLRHGLIPRDTLEPVAGDISDAGVLAAEGGDIRAPGMLASHYAPRRPLRLCATDVAADEALLAFGSQPPAGAAVTLNLSPTGDLVEAAANLFDHLHRLDARAPPVRAIAVMPVPDEGLGRAINDRLRRAATPPD